MLSPMEKIAWNNAYNSKSNIFPIYRPDNGRNTCWSYYFLRCTVRWGKKERRMMCITQKYHYDIIAVRLPLLDQYLCPRLLRHADCLLTYLLSGCNSTHYFYWTNYFVWEKNRNRSCLGFKSMHDAAKYCFFWFYFHKTSNLCILFFSAAIIRFRTESVMDGHGRTRRTRELNMCISITTA
jgi:hypothetical protein